MTDRSQTARSAVTDQVMVPVQSEPAREEVFFCSFWKGKIFFH